MITIQQNQVVPIPYEQLMDPETGRTGVRLVNIESLPYHSARNFMVRLDRPDFEDAALVERMANCTNLTPDAFLERFGYLGKLSPRPY